MASSIKTVVILSRRLHYFRWAESDSGETEPMGTSHHSNSFRNSAVDRQCDIRWANDLGNDPGYRALRPMKNRLRGDVLVQAVKGRPGKPSWFSPEKTTLSSIE
jgi:hypothetical protein